MNSATGVLVLAGAAVALGCIWMLLHTDAAGGRSQDTSVPGDGTNDSGWFSWWSGDSADSASTSVRPGAKRPKARPARGVHGQTLARAADYLGRPAASYRTETPTKGEGAPEDDWDDIAPEQRIERALADYERALDNARAADGPGERDQWRRRAVQALSAVRADMVSVDGDLERYTSLQERIDD